jgi:hypothetical protein
VLEGVVRPLCMLCQLRSGKQVLLPGANHDEPDGADLGATGSTGGARGYNGEYSMVRGNATQVGRMNRWKMMRTPDRSCSILQALVNLALHEGSGAQLVQEGAVPPLVQLCAKAEDKQVLASARWHSREREFSCASFASPGAR